MPTVSGMVATDGALDVCSWQVSDYVDPRGWPFWRAGEAPPFRHTLAAQLGDTGGQAMHALVVKVLVDLQSDMVAGRKALVENVAPRVSQAPGFVSGLWLAPDDQGHGLSVVIFESEEQANAGAGMARQLFESGQATAGVTLHSANVREVAASA
jgi:hypothetical protein